MCRPRISRREPPGTAGSFFRCSAHCGRSNVVYFVGMTLHCCMGSAGSSGRPCSLFLAQSTASGSTELLAPISLIAVAWISRMWLATHKLIWLLSMVPVAALALFTDTRSAAIEIAMALVLCLVVLRKGTSATSIGVVAVSGVMILAFSASANAGVLGDDVQQKWQAQGGTPLSVLVAGRPEVGFSVGALADARLVPHGSESEVTSSSYSAGAASLTALPPPEKNAVIDRITSNGLDLHSVVATAAWQGGTLCGLTFLVILFLAARRAIWLQRAEVWAFGPVYVYGITVVVWDFLFSPWTYFTGQTWGIMLAIVFASRPSDPQEPADD